jgi:hypothetical protein
MLFVREEYQKFASFRFRSRLLLLLLFEYGRMQLKNVVVPRDEDLFE